MEADEVADVPAPQITCPRCGCVVGDQQAHAKWHQAVAQIGREAHTCDAAFQAALKDLTG